MDTREAESRSGTLFAYAPLPTWELDLSGVEQLLVERSVARDDTLAARLEAEPELMTRCAERVRVVEVNRAAMALVGADADAPSKEGAKPVVPVPTLFGARHLLAALWAGARTATTETTFTTPGGEVLALSVYASACPGAGGPLGCVIVTVVDVTERRAAEAALLRHEQRQQLALSAGGIGTFDMELATGKADWSPEVAELWGMPPGYAGTLADFCWAHMHPDDLSWVQAAFATAVTRPESTDLEFRVVRPDGALRWVRWRGQVTRDAPGAPEHILGVNLDITERKRSEAALRASDERFLVAFRSSPAASLIIRADDGRIVDVNETFLQLFGYAREEVLEHTALELGLYENPTDRTKLIDVARAAGHSSNVELVSLTRTKQRRETLAAAAELTIGGVKHFLVTSFDVTQQKRDEERLRLLWHAIEQCPVAISIGSSDGTLEYVNRRYLEVNACAPEDVLGRNPLRDGGLSAEAWQALSQAVAAGTEWRSEVQVRRKEGESYWARILVSPIRDQRGAITHQLSIAEDTTERRRLEESVRLAQKMDAFGQLAAGVAHDFNNLLTVMVGNLSLLSEGADDEGTALAEISEAASRATNLTRQLLTFSRRQPQLLETVDLNQVSAGMTRMLRRLIGEHIKLTEHFTPGGAIIRADSGMMEQVLVNLAVNARDAMPQGGELEVRTEVVKLDPRQASVHPRARPGRFVRLTVRDTGTGIQPRDLGRIFEPFFTTKEVGKGTGLGLATVFGIVEQHEGWIEVESTVGVGTAFHVFLPLLAPETRPTPLPGSLAAVQPGPHPAQTVLVVEDEDQVRRLFRRLLEGRGYHVLEASNGVEALKLWAAKREEISLLLTDMVMPGGIGGRRLAEHLCAEKPGLKVIYSSGYVPDGADLAPKGNAVFLAKPFNANALILALRELLPQG